MQKCKPVKSLTAAKNSSLDCMPQESSHLHYSMTQQDTASTVGWQLKNSLSNGSVNGDSEQAFKFFCCLPPPRLDGP